MFCYMLFCHRQSKVYQVLIHQYITNSILSFYFILSAPGVLCSCQCLVFDCISGKCSLSLSLYTWLSFWSHGSGCGEWWHLSINIVLTPKVNITFFRLNGSGLFEEGNVSQGMRVTEKFVQGVQKLFKACTMVFRSNNHQH